MPRSYHFVSFLHSCLAKSIPKDWHRLPSNPVLSQIRLHSSGLPQDFYHKLNFLKHSPKPKRTKEPLAEPPDPYCESQYFFLNPPIWDHSVHWPSVKLCDQHAISLLDDFWKYFCAMRCSIGLKSWLTESLLVCKTNIKAWIKRSPNSTLKYHNLLIIRE